MLRSLRNRITNSTPTTDDNKTTENNKTIQHKQTSVTEIGSWVCSKCTVINKPKTHTCATCETKRTYPSTITIYVQYYDQNDKLIDAYTIEEKYSLSIGYLQDLLYNQTKINNTQQLLLYNDCIVDCSNDNIKVVDLLCCNVNEPITLTLKHDTDRLNTPIVTDDCKQYDIIDMCAESSDADWGADDVADSDWDADDDGASTNPDIMTDATSIQQTQKNYKLLTQQQIYDIIDQYTAQLTDILSIAKTDALLLLIQYDYNIDRIVSLWTNNESDTRKHAGIGSIQQQSPIHLQKKLRSSDVSCMLCYDDIDVNKGTVRLACEHLFCNSCWYRWIQSQHETQGASALRVKCLGECKLYLPVYTQIQLLKSDSDKNKVKRWLIDSFVTSQRSTYSACVGANCTIVAQATTNSTDIIGGVQCMQCNTLYCFQCQIDDHTPVRCKTADKWIKKNQSESENVLWISANTKPCPKCNAPVEKNGGCSHMNCIKCKHAFCWLCLQEWKTHGYTQCTVFTEPNLKKKYNKTESDREKAQNELRKYMFFFERYENHMKAVKIATKQLTQTQQRAEQLQSIAGAGIQQVVFLLDAFNTVIHTKRILAWCWCYMYYFGNTNAHSTMSAKDVPKDYKLDIYHPDKPIIEKTIIHVATNTADILIQQNLTQLEELIERLNSYIEKKIEELSEPTVRTDVISLTNTVQKYRTNICQHIYGRMEELIELGDEIAIEHA